MGKDINTETTLRMLDSVIKIGLLVDSMNKLLIEKGVYTEKDLENYCDKLEKENEDVQILKQVLALLEYLS